MPRRDTIQINKALTFALQKYIAGLAQRLSTADAPESWTLKRIAVECGVSASWLSYLTTQPERPFERERLAMFIDNLRRIAGVHANEGLFKAVMESQLEAKLTKPGTPILPSDIAYVESSRINGVKYDSLRLDLEYFIGGHPGQMQISGPPMSGKTSIERLLRLMAGEWPATVTAEVRFQHLNWDLSSTVDQELAPLINTLEADWSWSSFYSGKWAKARWPRKEDGTMILNENNLLKWFLTQLRHRPVHSRSILVLENMHLLSSTGVELLFHTFRALREEADQPSGRLYIVLIGGYGSNKLDHTWRERSSFIGVVDPILSLSGFSLEDVNKMGKALNREDTAPIVWEYFGGQPFLTHAAFSDVTYPRALEEQQENSPLILRYSYKLREHGWDESIPRNAWTVKFRQEKDIDDRVYDLIVKAIRNQKTN